MHSGIGEAQRTVGAKGLLELQAPLLVLRPMGLIVHDVDSWRGKERVRFLDLSERLPRSEPIQKGRVRRSSDFEQAIRFLGSQIVAEDVEGIKERRVIRQECCNITWKQIVKDPDSAPYHEIVRHAQRLPGKAESRRPLKAVRILGGLFLIQDQRLIVRLIGIVTYGIERPGELTKQRRSQTGLEG